MGKQRIRKAVQPPKTDKLITMVRTQREQKKLSHREAAAEIGIPHTTLQSIEEGSIPTLQNFFALCDWLNSDPRLFAPTSSQQSVIEPGHEYDPYRNGWTSI